MFTENELTILSYCNTSSKAALLETLQVFDTMTDCELVGLAASIRAKVTPMSNKELERLRITGS